MTGKAPVGTGQVETDVALLRGLVDVMWHPDTCPSRQRGTCNCEVAPYAAALERLRTAALGGGR
ncbi:hypothetical protein [Comamonas sp. JC664]|uniref:hypothetical protein n=1 Tax=Comamonas sp. JC664 TaxID=2801917 RepID=UPI0017488616|nr:hypothetical protein [Comamonas sp. JC664]MBL0698974.1 hypothetical protein [Comamonas sp. JC664]GHG79867.1 hypothetical protein GCM10012319_32170 [Comamonas sp. KCTC 72670]